MPDPRLNGEKKTSREEFWFRAATWTFGLWAVMIPLGIKFVADYIKRTEESTIKVTAQFDAYRETDKERMTTIGERQDEIRRKLVDMEIRMRALERSDHGNGK